MSESKLPSSYKSLLSIYLSVFSIAFCLHCSHAFAHADKENESANLEPEKVGNFALPSTQQPGPLISLGQNIVDRSQLQTFLLADKFVGSKQHTFDLVPSALYGITDGFSVYFNLPIAASYKSGSNHSSGLEDMFLQFEYAYYSKKTSEFSEQATFLTNATFPTGSTKKNPPTGVGSPSFLVAGTFNRVYTDWFVFTSPGAVLTTSHHGTKFGNQFLYQFGFGRNIFSINSEWIVAWMLELDGQYSQKNKIRGVKDPDSGGNVIYVTPSLWVSSKRVVLQLGIGLPVAQRLYGNQTKNNYMLVANLGWTF